MMRALLTRLRRDRRGAATLEFALWASLILAGLVPCLDFALYLMQQSRLSSTVSQAAILGYNMRTASSVDVNQLSQFISGTPGISSGTVTPSITCNGGLQSCATTPSNRVCACTTGVNPVSYAVAASCGATCASGATSGFYMTVGGSYTYRSTVSNPWLNGKTVTSATTVRLQ